MSNSKKRCINRMASGHTSRFHNYAQRPWVPWYNDSHQIETVIPVCLPVTFDYIHKYLRIIFLLHNTYRRWDRIIIIIGLWTWCDNQQNNYERREKTLTRMPHPSGFQWNRRPLSGRHRRSQLSLDQCPHLRRAAFAGNRRHCAKPGATWTGTFRCGWAAAQRCAAGRGCTLRLHLKWKNQRHNKELVKFCLKL